MSNEDKPSQINSSDLGTTTKVDPSSLDTIRQVEYMLEFLSQGKTTGELAAKFAEGHYYVLSLINLFKRIGCIEGKDSKWFLTDSGRHDLELFRRAKSETAPS